MKASTGTPRTQRAKAGPPCKCGHGLYEHYLCGDSKTRCLHRECKCEAFWKSENRAR